MLTECALLSSSIFLVRMYIRVVWSIISYMYICKCMNAPLFSWWLIPSLYPRYSPFSLLTYPFYFPPLTPFPSLPPTSFSYIHHALLSPPPTSSLPPSAGSTSTSDVYVAESLLNILLDHRCVKVMYMLYYFTSHTVMW